MAALMEPAIILTRPQMGENIGAAARAMLNFGLTDLRLVAPRDGWPNPKAIAMASGPFGPFGADMRKKADQIAVVSRFKFTRDQTLETSVR